MGSLDCILAIPEFDPFENLNETQKEVVAHIEGPAILCSVAGSGKTRTVIQRLANLMMCHNVPPDKILATTFTRKAAGEMRDRAEKIGCHGVAVHTFHALCMRIIKHDSPWQDFEVDDKNRMGIVLKEITGFRQMNWKGVDITDLENFISACKNSVVAPGPFPEFFKAKELRRHPAWFQDSRFAQAYCDYEEERERRKLLTFDDMLYLAVTLLESDERVRDYWARKFDHVMVDEFQDSNRAQYLLMQILSEHAKSLLVVGDDDQLIYAWRGSVPEYTTGFEAAFGAKVFRMESNYRSTAEILDAANKVIVHNSERIAKTNRETRGAGQAVIFRAAGDTDAEAENAIETMKELNQDGARWGDMAVLYRTNAQSRPFEEVLIREKIPHIVVGGIDFYKRKEVVDILSYLRVAVDESDDDSCQRALNRPFRYIGKVTIENLRDGARSRDSTLFQYLRTLPPNEVRMQSRQYEAIETFVELVQQLKQDLTDVADCVDLLPEFRQNKPTLPQALSNLIKRSGYEQWIISDEGKETCENSRLSNLRELVRTSVRFKTGKELLDYIDNLAIEKAKRKKKISNAVQISTIHQAKGLEFNTVFLAGCAENILPHGRSDDIEEERRLFYVGVTRARDRLFVSSPKSILVANKEINLDVSRFVSEAGIL